MEPSNNSQLQIFLPNQLTGIINKTNDRLNILKISEKQTTADLENFHKKYKEIKQQIKQQWKLFEQTAKKSKQIRLTKKFSAPLKNSALSVENDIAEKELKNREISEKYLHKYQQLKTYGKELYFFEEMASKKFQFVKKMLEDARSRAKNLEKSGRIVDDMFSGVISNIFQNAESEYEELGERVKDYFRRTKNFVEEVVQN